jgi:glycerophosphoryl diester phosphodiesterase
MLIYAHRGLSGRYPENTLLAFRQALAAGVDGLEFDVHVTSDGVPVVIHDRDIARTTDGSGNVDEMRLTSVQKLDSGAGERVPTLADVLALAGDAVHLDIEIKGLGAERATLDVLVAFPGARWAVSSFDWGILRELHRLDHRAELWPLTRSVDAALFAIATDLGSPAVALWTDAYTEASASALREAGLRTVIWTVNERAEAERVRALGAYALCTDDPDRILRSASRTQNAATQKG